MRLWATLLASALAVAATVFHMRYQSSLPFATLRVLVIWFGIAALCLVVNHFWQIAVGNLRFPEMENTDHHRRLDLVSRPEDDDYFR